MTEVAKLRAKRQVTDALRLRNGPQTNQIHSAAVGSQVLVWRIHQKKWTGPFQLLSVEGNTCTVNLPTGPTNFRSTVVKPFLQQNSENNDTPELPVQIDNSAQNSIDTANYPDNQHPQPIDHPRRNVSRNRRLPNRYRNQIDVHVMDLA
ncbi:hypothetical protein K3495_g12016 [Podosphaera aphanis]|nr:hypothetical protein K3495_g12016 [Podosphaera aphanis]